MYLENSQIRVTAYPDVKFSVAHLYCLLDARSPKKTNKIIRNIEQVFIDNGVTVLSIRFNEFEDRKEFICQ